MKIILRPLLTMGCLYALLVLLLFLFQRSLLYLPDTSPPDPDAAFSEFGIRPVTFATRDGVKLRSWWRPASQDDSSLAVLIMQGNAGHAGYRFAKFTPLINAGYNVLFLEYRGYGGNPGNPTEIGLRHDAQAAINHLTSIGFRPEQTVLYGESLGCGIAIHLAAHHRFAGVVLEAPYTSIADVAQDHYWFVPARWLTRDKFNSLSKVPQVKSPLLIIHGESDGIIDREHSKRLYAVANDPKEVFFVAGAGHNDLYDFDTASTVLRFLEALH